MDAAVRSPETGEAPQVLLEVHHADLPSPFFWTNQATDQTSGGQVYTPAAFEVLLPGESDQDGGGARLVFDNVGREFIAAVRSISSDLLTVKIRIARKADADDIMVEYPFYELARVMTKELTVEGDLVEPDSGGVPAISKKFAAGEFAALL